MDSPSPSTFSHSVLDQGVLTALTPKARREARRRQRLVVLGLVLASYVVDGLLLLVLSALGTVPWQVPVAYMLVGTLSCGLFYAVMEGVFGEAWRDHYLVAPQMLLTTAINIGFMLWAPQVGLLLLMVLFAIFGFGALRMSTGAVMSAGLGIAGLVGALFMLIGDRLDMPTATWQERVVSGVWFALLLMRIAFLGYVSARYRRTLAQRNKQLADTFEKLARLANRDELTGALNRRSIMRLLEDEHQRMQRTGVPFSVALVDMDHFKQINDTLGHAVGDEVLRGFTVRAAAAMRTNDRLGRYGGEEFLLVFASTQDEPAAVAATERVRAGVAGFDWTAIVPPSLPVSVSAGVALCRAGETVTQLLARADAALYVAKRDGRNCVRLG